MLDSQQATVVVIDDDPSLRESVAILFSTFGYRCISYASAEAYIGHPVPDTPCCMVLDLHLPGISGLELLRCINAKSPGMPVLFVSGEASAKERDQALTAGAVQFLRKPVDPSELLAHTQSCLYRSLEAQ